MLFWKSGFTVNISIFYYWYNLVRKSGFQKWVRTDPKKSTRTVKGHSLLRSLASELIGCNVGYCFMFMNWMRRCRIFSTHCATMRRFYIFSAHCATMWHSKNLRRGSSGKKSRRTNLDILVLRRLQSYAINQSIHRRWGKIITSWSQRSK